MYDNKQKQLIHQLMEAVFSGEELDAFCAEHFPELAGRFPVNMDNASKIRQMIEACTEQGELGRLVVNIKNTKPQAYQSFVDRLEEAAQQNASTEPSGAKQPTPPTLTVFPDEVVSAVEMARTTSRGGEIIPNAEALLQQSLAGRYQIDQVLDKSGLGAVFKAYDTKLEIDVAIKVIDLNRVKQPAIKERVRQEVRTGMQLDHPSIVKVYDFGQTDSLLYIIMEFIPGYNLRQARQYFKTIDSKIALTQVIQLFKDICLTVDYMHQQRVLHPGTKPENIMLKQGQSGQETAWRPVLINLGLLRPNTEMVMSREAISQRRLTYTVSPELLLGHATDIRSDVYALGVLLYDLAVGQPPFRPKDIGQAVRYHVETQPPPPHTVNPNISEELEKIILKALAKNPADRFLSAKGMAQALADCLDGAALPAPEPQAEIIAAMDARPLTVAPGESVTTKITLRNQGQKEEHCQVTVEGIPIEWVSIAPASTKVAPEQEQVVELTIQPPRTPQSRAGRHSLTIQVSGRQDSEPIDEIKKVLTVAPYSRFSSSIWPKEILAGQVTQVTVENEGNAPESFTIRPKPEKGVSFKPEQAQFKLPSGESRTVDFRVTSAGGSRIIGDSTTRTFSILVSTSQSAPVTLSGQVTSRGLVTPKVLVFSLVALIMLLCAMGTYFYSLNTPAWVIEATQTQAAAETSQANATQTATVQLGATQSVAIQQAATQAATETALWLEKDSDGDGLTNRQELEYKTTPDNWDSDGDTLPDGAEINDLETDPTLPDTDFDGVRDDEEVRNIWDPASRDTDNDGTPDSVDADPNSPDNNFSPPQGTVTPLPITVGFARQQTFLSWEVFGDRPRYSINENQDKAIIEVELNRPVDRQIQVDYAINNTNATLGQDYNFTRGTVAFAPNQTSLSIEVEIINNDTPEENELIVLELSNPSSGVEIDTPRADLVIIDDD